MRFEGGGEYPEDTSRNFQAELYEIAATTNHPGCELTHQDLLPQIHVTGREVPCEYTSQQLGGVGGARLHCSADILRTAGDGRGTGKIGQPGDELSITNDAICTADFLGKGGIRGLRVDFGDRPIDIDEGPFDGLMYPPDQA
ncbi:MAG TPA: hypothetical protein VJP80_03795 [Candidatus Saccharimonadales bacterium]|nr:hypothetical protein [Candidatus Saccharimonadales bacterium]